MNRQEILEALKNDNYYRNLSDKDFFDANNLDNLAKYLEHNFAKTDESKKVILDMLSHKKHNPNDLMILGNLKPTDEIQQSNQKSFLEKKVQQKLF